MIISMAEQGSEAWFQDRIGCVTASNVNCIISPTAQPSSRDRRNTYMNKLLASWKMQKPLTEWEYKSAAMQAGNDNEESAVALFELEQDIKTEKVGFIFKDDKKLVGCSPDRMIGLHFSGYFHDDGSSVISCEQIGNVEGVEIKNPLPWTQIGYLLKGKCPTDYIPQVQSSMWVTGACKWWFMSNCAGLDPLIVEVKRDDDYIEKMEKLVNAFVEEMLEKREKLK